MANTGYAPAARPLRKLSTTIADVTASPAARPAARAALGVPAPSRFVFPPRGGQLPRILLYVPPNQFQAGGSSETIWST